MPKRYSSREIIKLIEEDGWCLIMTKGSHHQFSHDTKKGRVTIPHPKKDIDVKTAHSIFKQAGVKNQEKK